MHFTKTAIAAFAVVVGAGTAQAATLVTILDEVKYNGNLVYVDDTYKIDSPFLYKCDDIDAKNPSCTDDGPSKDYFDISFDPFDEEATSGGWEWSGGGDFAPHYMIVKAGSTRSGGGYALYDIAGETSGYWDTLDVGGKGISHIAFFNTGVDVIPLPASALLLIGGLGGLAMMRRRKKA